jgi:hypothetical protein
VGVIDHKVAREAGIDFYSSEDMVVVVVEESDEKAIEAAVEEAMIEMEDEVVAEEEMIELEPSANDRLGLDSEDETCINKSVPSSVLSSVPSSVSSSVSSSSLDLSSVQSVTATQSVEVISNVRMPALISQLVTSLEEPIRRIAQETARAVVGDAVQKVREEMESKRKCSSSSTVNKKQRK